MSIHWALWFDRFFRLGGRLLVGLNRTRVTTSNRSRALRLTIGMTHYINIKLAHPPRVVTHWSHSLVAQNLHNAAAFKLKMIHVIPAMLVLALWPLGVRSLEYSRAPRRSRSTQGEMPDWKRSAVV